jgi:hypothetical protein
MLAVGARTAPGEHFANTPRAVFLRRLQAAATRFGFEILDAQLCRPLQQAAFVVVQTRDPQALSRATYRIEQSIDPHPPAGSPHAKPPFEGLYLEARNARGAPFMVLYDSWRGSHGTTGEWASSERLYPFPHH